MEVYILFNNFSYKGIYNSYINAFKEFVENCNEINEDLRNLEKEWRNLEKDELDKILKKHNWNIVQDKIHKNYIVLQDYA